MCVTENQVSVYVLFLKESFFLSADPWVEITPYEAGYSLTGAFVDVSRFGSQFHEGLKRKDQPEMDMLYLQGNKLCYRKTNTTKAH